MSNMEIEDIYQLSNELDNGMHDISEAVKIFAEASESNNHKLVRLLGIQMLFRHFHRAPNQNDIQEFVYKMLNDPEKDVRMLIINNLPNLCRSSQLAEPVSYVLAQLLAIAKGPEQALVQKSLSKVFSSYPEVCICSIYNCAMESTTTQGKIRIMWFLESHMPENIDFSARIKNSINNLYIELIHKVDSNDAAYLIQCLSLSTNFSFTQSLNALSERIREDIFDINGVLLFVATKLLSGIVDPETKNEQTLARLQFLNSLLVKADLITFESIVERSVLIGIVDDNEIRILASKILDVFCQERVDPFNDLSECFHKLNRIVILCKADLRSPVRETVLEWLLEDISILETLEPRQQKNYFMAIVTLSTGKRMRLSESRLIKPVFRYIWRVAPDLNSNIHTMDIFELEIIAHYLRSILDITPFLYGAIEETNYKWRECLHHFAALLVLTNKGLGQLLLKPKPNYHVQTMQRQFFIIAKISKMFCLILQDHKVSEGLQEPSWVNTGDVFEDITFTHVLNNKEIFTLTENPTPTFLPKRVFNNEWQPPKTLALSQKK